MTQSHKWLIKIIKKKQLTLCYWGSEPGRATKKALMCFGHRNVMQLCLNVIWSNRLIIDLTGWSAGGGVSFYAYKGGANVTRRVLLWLVIAEAEVNQKRVYQKIKDWKTPFTTCGQQGFMREKLSFSCMWLVCKPLCPGRVVI